ncbi:MAG: cytochrome c oxidase subunit II [Gemmatimonadota bacterium]
MKIHAYERAFLRLGAAMLVAFLGALGYSAFAMGVRLPSRAGEIDPKLVRETPPFDHPGLRRTGPDTYEVVLLAQAWSFNPREIEIPAGATVTFRATSADVVHGLSIEGTRVNAMLLPGQITVVTHRFDEPGEHLLICHEYCGLLHHTMGGIIRVTAAGRGGE